MKIVKNEKLDRWEVQDKEGFGLCSFRTRKEAREWVKNKRQETESNQS